MPLTEIVFLSKNLNTLDQEPEKQAIFFRRFQAREGKRDADVGGRVWSATHAREKFFAFEAFLLREAGTWGLKKNSKMAAVRHQGGFSLPCFEYFQGL